MPKMKTNSSAKKRFKLTGSGKIKRKHAFKSSHFDKESNKREKRNLTKATLVHKSDLTEYQSTAYVLRTYSWLLNVKPGK